MSKLAELNLDGKTVIVFTSDNGGLSTSEGTPTSNLPLRMGKGWNYEGGVRDDLGEQNDLASKLPGKVGELRRQLHDWRKEVDAQMMTANPDFKAAAAAERKTP